MWRVVEWDRGYRRGLPRGVSYESGAASAVVTCQRVVESHRIRRREWSSIMAVNMVCQGVMELRRVCRREWSSVVAVTVTL